MNADGRYVTFASTSSKLVPGQVDTNNSYDVFVYDRVAGTTALVTRAPGTQATVAPSVQGSFGTDISADGRFIAFSSAAATLVPGQTDVNRTFDIFLHDRVARTTVLASHTRDSAGTAGNGHSSPLLLSADGKVIAFSSLATNLIGEPSDEPSTLFVYLRTTAEVAAVPLRDPDNPSVAADAWSSAGGISADGRYVVFQSLASNLVPGQIDYRGSDPEFDPGTYDVFLRDQVSGKTVLVSHGSSSPLTSTTGFSPILSADGKLAAFLTSNNGTGLRLYDQTADSSILVNHAPGLPTQLEGSAFGPAISADGRFVAFQCRGCGLIAGQLDGNPGQSDDTDIFLFDRVMGVYTLVSHASGSLLAAGDRDSTQPAISADGRFVVFLSAATNLVAGQAGGGSTDPQIFVFDRTTGMVTLVSHATGAPTTAANGYSYPGGISADGRWIFFPSFAADLVPGQVDADGKSDVFLYDRVSGTTLLVSHSASSPTTAADGSSWPRSISADGRRLAFESEAAGLVPGVSDTNRAYDVFLFDRVAGTTALVSYASGSSNVTALRGAISSTLSADGSRIAFFSTSPDVVPGQAPPVGHTVLFLQELSTGVRSILGPVRTAGSSGSTGYLDTIPRMSDDGRKVAFTSDVPLTAGDFNDTWDVYFFDAAGVPGGPVAVTPCTLLDTRRAADRPVLRSDVQRSVTVRGVCGVPATAKRVVVKVTTLASSGKGNLRFYPGAVTATPSGILRFERGATRIETFTLPLGPLGTTGALTILPFVAGKGTVHAIVEVTGYSR
jgi:Tol biopolymer transport system component